MKLRSELHSRCVSESDPHSSTQGGLVLSQLLHDFHRVQVARHIRSGADGHSGHFHYGAVASGAAVDILTSVLFVCLFVFF